MTGVLLIHGAGTDRGAGTISRPALRCRPRCSNRTAARPRSTAPGRIWHRIDDYLEDVRRAAAQFPDRPSWSGTRWAGCWRRSTSQTSGCRGAVLMASIPPAGTISAAARLDDPAPAGDAESDRPAALAAAIVATSALVPRAVLHRRHSRCDVVHDCHARVQDESYPRVRGPAARAPGPAQSARRCWCWAPSETGSSRWTRCTAPLAPTARERRSFPAWATT